MCQICCEISPLNTFYWVDWSPKSAFIIIYSGTQIIRREMVKLQFILINARSWQWWHFNFFLLDLSPRKYFLKYWACNIWFRVYLDFKQQSNTFRVPVTDRKVGKCDNKFVLMIILRWGIVLIRIIVNIFLGLLSVKFGRFLCWAISW